MRFKKATLAALVAGFGAMQLAATAGMAADPSSKITITGEGRVDARPDMATINLGVQTQGKTAAEALTANSTGLAAVIERLKAGGIEDRDLQTSGLSLGPQMDYSREGKPPVVTGYEATNQLAVRVRDLNSLGGVLDRAVGDGANLFQGLTFGLSESGPALDEARVKAVEDARRKAEMIATAAGVKLGQVIEINEQQTGGDPRPMFRRDAAVAQAASVPVEGGEVSYGVNVTVTWSLEPK